MTEPLDGNRPYTVVVGVSGTSKSAAALKWAQCQAQHCGGQLIAIRAWRMPNPPASPAGAPTVSVPEPAAVEEHARKALADDVASVLGEDHGAEVRLVQGGKLKVLVQAAAEADLLVVDAPRKLTAGPFAHRLIYAASCPVLSMPPAPDEEDSSVARVAGAVARSLVPSADRLAEYPAYRPPTRL